MNNPGYNYVVVESDQVRNTNWLTMDQFKFFLLDSVDDDKKVAYAASFGIDNIKEGYAQIFKEALKNFKAISVCEDRGKELINSMANMEVPVVLDPTMLLSRKEWFEIIDDVTIGTINEPYVFEYFLGKKTANVRKKTKAMRRKIGKTIEFHNSKGKSRKNFHYGPLEFVKAISNVELVITDSYHAAVFSLMFGVPVIISERNDGNGKMNSKIDTLFKSAGMEKVTLEEFESLEQVEYMKDFDMDKQMVASRKMSQAFLDEAFLNN